MSVLVGGCGSDDGGADAQSTTTAIASSATSCNSTDADLKDPAKNPDMIMWMHAPRVEDSAEVIGGFDVLSCGDQWRSAQPTGAGYCTIIARSSDNPGYDVDVKPAPRPSNPVDTVGDC
ncbi:hypothetical protein A5788_10815 [Gordonia sp. 852002-50816_SCH5313054-c]|nr:hypothetical protein A5786_04210 [Gordonia sp. 852002-50816_SCH5313054-a]OBC18090.1 hypothetical protein A5788_10815 [Gordonia sp. 852002-50816_SCH5313054-c]